MTVKDYQDEIETLLGLRFEHQDIKTEWRTKMNKGLYSPRVDVAVGPFAIEDGVIRTAEHQELFGKHENLFARLAEQHLKNIDRLTDDTNDDERTRLIRQKLQHLQYTNLNGRCFLSIEIENKTSRKHLMGGAVNAAVLGKVGIAVGYNNRMHKAFLNLYRYFEFLRDVEKPTFNTSNLLIISSEQLTDVLSEE